MIPEIVGDVPNRYMGSHETAGVYDRPQRRCRDGEGQHSFGMGVNNRVNVRARFEDRAVNKSFEIRRATVVAYRISVQGEFHNVGALDQLRTARTRQEVALGMAGMAKTDVAVCIYYAFVGEDSVGDHELADVEVQIVHGLSIQRGVDIGQMRRRCASGALSVHPHHASRRSARADLPPARPTFPRVAPGGSTIALLQRAVQRARRCRPPHGDSANALRGLGELIDALARAEHRE